MSSGYNAHIVPGASYRARKEYKKLGCVAINVAHPIFSRFFEKFLSLLFYWR